MFQSRVNLVLMLGGTVGMLNQQDLC
jgi:hypothetical protein